MADETSITTFPREALPDGVPFPPSHIGRRLSLPRSGLHTTLKSELALIGSAPKAAALAVFTVLMVLFPFHAEADLTKIATLAMIAVVGAVGLTLVSGAAGQLSLGHAAFFGIGAYSAAWVTQNQSWSFWWSLPVAALMSGLVGLLLAPIALRLRGLYLAVVTIGLVYGMQHLFRVAESITGGVNGSRVAPPEFAGLDFFRGGSLGGITFERGVPYYFLTFVVAVLAVLLATNLLRSPVGRSFAAIRDQEIAAGVVGVNPFRAKTQAFVISSALTGVAGALLGGYLRFVNFEQWDLQLSIEYLAIIVIGGLGSVTGAVLGAIFVTVLPEFIDSMSGFLPFLGESSGTGLTVDRLSAIMYGLLLTLVVVVEPEGLHGIWRRIKRYFNDWPFRGSK